MPPKVTVKNVDETEQHAPKSKRNRRSNFFLTLNTNKKFNPHSEEYQVFNNKFKQSLNEIYDDIGNYLKIKEAGATYDENVIVVDIESGTEIGPKTGSAHSHTIISVKHNTLVQLDYEKMKEKIKRDLGLSNMYVNNKLFYNASQTLLDYVSKNY
jgi:uncharacterized protein YwqG